MTYKLNQICIKNNNTPKQKPKKKKSDLVENFIKYFILYLELQNIFYEY